MLCLHYACLFHPHCLINLIDASVCIYSHIQFLFCSYLTVVVQDTGLSTPQFNLLFPIGHRGTTNCIDIPITSDTELEDDHDFNVTIIDAPPASIGTPSVATVTIEDDESKQL